MVQMKNSLVKFMDYEAREGDAAIGTQPCVI